jgi:hypothetical protein
MDSIIKELRKKPFSGEDILNITDNQTKIITYPELYNFKTIDDVFKPYDSVVILYETKPNYGHWVCLLKHGNKIEFFDPYGFFIDDQLEFINKKFRKQNNEDFPILSKMLLDSKYKIVYSKAKLQKYSGDISSCGRHVTFRIVMRDLPLNEYVKLLKHNKYDPDMIVTYLTAFL